MPVRSCVVCRSRSQQGELIRISLDPEGRLVPDLDRRRPGRGAWVCPRRACVSALSARPRLASRALHVEIGPSAGEGLGQAVERALNEEARDLLVRCARAGAVISGSGHVEAASGSFAALIRATDASERTLEAVRARLGPVVEADIGLDVTALGRLIHRGPRAVVAVRTGTPGDELANRLRWRRALG